MNIIINLLFIFILGIFVIVYNLNKLYYNYGNAINVPRELLYNVLKPGIYEGVSTTSGDVLSSMDGCLYKNGQKSIHRLYISKTLNGIKFENIIKVHDSVSGDFLHTLKRDGEFTYMHKQNDNLYKLSRNYIDDKLVGASYGYVTDITNNSITANLHGVWHISSKEYHNVSNVMKRLDNNHLESQLIHKYLGFSDILVDQKYTMLN